MITIADWVIVIFTGGICGVTVIYAVITWKMLRQAKKIFLTDILIRLQKDIRSFIGEWYDRKASEKQMGKAVKGYIVGLKKALDYIDEDAAKDIYRALKKYTSGYLKTQEEPKKK